MSYLLKKIFVNIHICWLIFFIFVSSYCSYLFTHICHICWLIFFLSVGSPDEKGKVWLMVPWHYLYAHLLHHLYSHRWWLHIWTNKKDNSNFKNVRNWRSQKPKNYINKVSTLCQTFLKNMFTVSKSKEILFEAFFHFAKIVSVTENKKSQRATKFQLVWRWWSCCRLTKYW